MPNPLDEVFSRYGPTMSIEECADLLRVDPQQIRRRIRLPADHPRHLPGYRPGGARKLIIPTAAVRAYIEAGAIHGPDDDPDTDPADTDED